MFVPELKDNDITITSTFAWWPFDITERYYYVQSHVKIKNHIKPGGK